MSGDIIVDNTIASQVVRVLRNDIITKRIKAGSRITIKEISERYGVSNMPVREAFRTLEGEKLLEMNPYKGATVLNIDVNFIRDTYGIIRALESLITEEAMDDIDDAAVAHLHEINQSIAALKREEIAEGKYNELNSEFHNIIFAFGKNAKALDILRYQNSLILALRSVYVQHSERIKLATSQHAKIASALSQKDRVLLRVAVDEHTISAMEDFLQQFKEEN